MEKYEFRPTLTYTLMGICITVYFLELYIGYALGEKALENFFLVYGLSLKSVLNGNFVSFLSSIFIHAGPGHIILNVIALYFFGKVVEEHMGRKKMIAIFFLSAFAGEIFVLLSSLVGIVPASVPTVGASAAIFGLMGAAMLVRPFDFVFYPYLIPVPLVLVAVIYVLYNIGEFLAVLITGVETEVSYVSHLGGLLVGMIFGFREEGTKRGILILVLIIALMIILPLFWYLLNYLEFFNYASKISEII